MGRGILLSGEVDFMIHGVFKYKFFGHTVWITTSHICLLIVLMVLIGFAIVANIKLRHASDVPSGFQNFVELIVEKLDGMVSNVLGKNGRKKYGNYICTIFIFILMSNLAGLFGLRPPTADYGVTLPLGLISFTLIHYNRIKHNNIKSWWKGICSPLPPWVPLWIPINIISDIAVPISLSLRLFANILSGTVMMALIYSLLSVIAYVWPAALHVYFDMFSGAIQTYVFCMLTMTYISSEMGEEA